MMFITSIFLAIKQELRELPRTFNDLMQKFITIKNRQKPSTRESSSLNWCKVGQVKTLLVYPLITGIAENVTSCYLHDTGMIGHKNGITIGNHMFVVYNEKTNTIQKINEIFNYAKMTISVKDENTMILTGANMGDILIILKDFVTGINRRTCMMSFTDNLLVKIEVSDCGENIAEWIKSYTNDKYLRLGYILRDLSLQQTFMHRYHILNSENDDCRNIIIPFENTPSVMLLSDQSFNKVNQIFPPLSLQKLRPNIILTTFGTLFNEMEWQRIKIGDAIVNNVKWRKGSETQINLKDAPMYIKRQNILLHCEIICSGLVKEGDDVYVLKEDN